MKKTAFQAALFHCLKKQGHGAQTKIAKKLGISQQLISAIKDGRSNGSEETRRELAKTFGYEYELFLKFGRSLLKSNENDHEQTCESKPYIAPQPKTLQEESLLEMPREILRSGNDYEESLAANIKSFHKSLQLEKRLN